VKITTTISSVLGLCLAAAPMAAQSFDASVVQGVTGSSGPSLITKATGGEPASRKVIFEIDGRLVRGLTSALLQRANQILIDIGPQLFGGQQYGQGTPGTLGVPGLSHFGSATPGKSMNLYAENSAGVATFGYLYVGYSSANIEMDFGGTLLVTPNLYKMRVPMAPGTVTIPILIPRNAGAIDSSIFMQMLVFDSGAAGGIAMSKGLELYL